MKSPERLSRGPLFAAAALSLLLLCGCPSRSREGPSAMPPSPDLALFEAALGLQQAGDFPKALDAFGRLLAGHPGSVHAEACLFWIAFDQAALGEKRKALSTLAQIIARWPTGSYADDAYLKAYQIHALDANEEDLKLARLDLETLLAKFPASPLAAEARFGLAQLYEASGQVDLALETYRKLLEQGAPASTGSGTIEPWMRKLEALRRSPDLGRFLRARHLFLHGRFKKALTELESITTGDADPLRDDLLYYTGLCLTHLGEWPRALSAFQTLSKQARDAELKEAAAENSRKLDQWIRASSSK